MGVEIVEIGESRTNHLETEAFTCYLGEGEDPCASVQSCFGPEFCSTRRAKLLGSNPLHADSSLRVLIAVKDKKYAGSLRIDDASYLPNSCRGALFISDVCVDSKQRNKGIGRALMKRVQELYPKTPFYLTVHGITPFAYSPHTIPSFKEIIRRYPLVVNFYKKIGFRVIEHQPESDHNFKTLMFADEIAA